MVKVYTIIHRTSHVTKNGKKLVVSIFRFSGSCCACGSVGALVGAVAEGVGPAAPNLIGINLYTKT